jgi:muconolactone delta-isomerase
MSKFLVIEKPTSIPFFSPGSSEGAEMMKAMQGQFEYYTKLQKEGKIVGGGPFLDIAGLCYILDVPSVEEMGEIFFSAPLNTWMQREVHPLGTFADTLEGIKEGGM